MQSIIHLEVFIPTSQCVRRVVTIVKFVVRASECIMG